MGVSSRESKRQHSVARDDCLFLAFCLMHLIQAFKPKPTTRFGNKEKLSPSSGRKDSWNVLPSLAMYSFHSFHPMSFPPCLSQDTSFILEPSHFLPRV